MWFKLRVPGKAGGSVVTHSEDDPKTVNDVIQLGECTKTMYI